MTIQEASALKQVTPQSIRDVLRDDVKRTAVFPSAHYVGEGKRGIWYLDAGEVERWQPRNYRARNNGR